MPHKNPEVARKYFEEYNHMRYGTNKISGYFVECEHCGEMVEKSLERITRRKHNFCNKRCAYSFRIGNIPWNKGTKGIMPIPWNKGMRTAKHPKDKDYQEYRLCSEYMDWRKKCLKRDLRLCQLCGTKKKVEVHHIKSYKDFPEERINIGNGITLCRSCHMYVHNVSPLDFQ